MKKTLLISALALFSTLMNAQSSATIAIQFYVDANSNCTYNAGEQLIHNVPYMLTYVNSGSSLTTAYSSSSFATCGSTLYVWTPSTTATNTLTIFANNGISANTSCSGSYNNIPYNTNTIQYIPVTVTGTSGVGVTVNYFTYATVGSNFTFTNFINTNTISVCSNLGTDSITLGMNIFNYFSCTSAGSVSPRTYSLFLDGVNYDILTTQGPFFNVTTTVGVNSMSHLKEYYYDNQTYLYLYPKLPSTFTVLGTHTLQVKSSIIYNNAATAIDFKIIIISIPCTKISGRFYNDCNNNCTFDAGDNYGVGWMATGKLYNSTGFNMIFHPNWSDGRFSIYAPTTATYALTQYKTYTTGTMSNFTACTTGTTTIPLASSTNTFLFGYKNNLGSTTDPGVYIYRFASTSQTINPTVGAIMNLALTNSWWNVCNSTASNPGKLKVTLPKFITYHSTVSGPTPTQVAGATVDTLIYTVPNFSVSSSWWGWNNAFASFSVVVSATAVPATQFTINASIFPTTDANLNNNSCNWVRVIGGPFDPNEKIAEAKGMQSNGDVDANTKQFYYTIGFQNIGNAPAINVRTLDTMDVNFDLNSLEVLQSSYPVSTSIDYGSRAVLFSFDGINLPAKMTDEPKSHGFVRYAIKLKNGVPANTVLKNRAHNYFDFNEPVATNQTVNKLVVLVSINEHGGGLNAVRAIPNPFSSQLRITSEKGIEHISVYNLAGSLVMDQPGGANETELDMERLPAAIYLVKVTSVDKGVTTIKVVKQ